MKPCQNQMNKFGPGLGKVCRLHHSLVHAKLDGLGLYRGQPPLLFALWKQEGQTHRELADKLHVSAATLSNMVKRMEKSGLMERRADENDERVSRVFLTQKGKDIQVEVDLAFEQINDDLTAGFSEEDIEQIQNIFDRLRENLLSAVQREHEKNKNS